ncbi:DNA replication regulator SLD3-domain-containing protein [Aspergillus taichungensis]|uniref:DNA replication regulator SLD3-domain-containing protein n=1 Tax=Aspergillus taichungensis TaxID=482145 RepID=A0A2J5HVP0_9EURO|nr:DNA replication regulator SLD3-domain-containing protein [Aspergillus taichungensis]
MASRGSASVLETIPLNHLPDTISAPPLKKRKTCHSPGDGEDQAIRIRAHGASLSDEPFVLEPIARIPRPRLPIFWLDVSPALSQTHPGSLFVADIPALEPYPDTDSAVLAVRLTSDGSLYVVERVKRGIYALSKLSRVVTERDIHALKGQNSASAASLDNTTRVFERVSDGAEWWQLAQVEDPMRSVEEGARARPGVSVVFGGVSDEHRVRDGVTPVGVPESRAQSAVPQLGSAPSAQSDLQTSTGPELEAQALGGVDPLAPQDLLDGLREQYLQALYVSKTSVAYFAKGPLARCRTAFQSAAPADLIAFYREAILTAKKMDHKYRETLPTSIRDALLSISDGETAPSGKKRKPRKKKLGKNGLYPEEEKFVHRWWKDRAFGEQGVLIETSRDTEVKKHVADLRLRETQLQILLILETLALEAEEAKKPRGDDAAEPPPTTKAKKPQDLAVMLELHLDRLCIWHAVSFEDTVVADSAKSQSNLAGKKVESDAVRDFCTEVIIPFYAARLPDKCKSITRKLGVSSSSPTKPPAKQKATPGPSGDRNTDRQASHRHPRRSFQRVHTDTQTTSQGRAAPAPSLNRTNTAPSQVNTRRESIDPLLPILSTSARGGIQKAKRAENREVDLNAVARQHESKLRKVQLLADQKKELDAAISALRKPNRQLVAKDIASDADRRTASGRKPKNPVRNPLGQGVQVAATPSKNRKRDANPDTNTLPAAPRSLARRPSRAPKTTAPSTSPFDHTDPDAVVIPGSAPRSNTYTLSMPSISVSDAANTIQETPLRRKAAQPFSQVEQSPGFSGTGTGNLFRVPPRPATRSADVAPSTPVSSRYVDRSFQMGLGTAAVLETPPRVAAPISVFGGDGRDLMGTPVKETPVKTRAEPMGTPVKETPVKTRAEPMGTPVKETPVKTRPEPMGTPVKKSVSGMGTSIVPMTPEKSIYEQLGWDDDDVGF